VAVSGPGFVEVAVPVPVEGIFDYALTADQTASPGVRVLVQYGGRDVVGMVVACKAEPSDRGRTREVLRVVDAEPVVPEPLLGVVLRAADDALCPPGIALAAAVPPGTAPRRGRRVTLLPSGRKALEQGHVPGTLGKVLWSIARAPVSEDRLRKRFPAAVPALDRMEQLGWLRREPMVEPARVRARTEKIYRVSEPFDLAGWREKLKRAPKRLRIVEELASSGPQPLRRDEALRALLRAGAVIEEEREVLREPAAVALGSDASAVDLTAHQRDAVETIGEAITRERDAGFLLYGVTGSGKTEVYLRATEQALAEDRGVIVLVPEISLTHQVVDRFRSRFGDQVAVLHSGLSAGERFDQWRRIRDGVFPIVIGARSAVFAPIERLGLIVIDEEHDGAYRSDEGFRYHAREIARLRAAASRCPVVMGSATPDVETTWRAQNGELERLVLPERVTKRSLPRVEIVDMTDARGHGKRFRLLSRELRIALAKTLAAGQQAILFLNRRGFATMAYCFNCGTALRCRHCDISLVYHATGGPRRADDAEQGELRCHYCGYREDPQPRCSGCNSADGALLGFGTERLHEEVSSTFPHARTARLDRDTSARKGAQQRILQAFHRGESDVLVGTQMVAKGHDVPGVTLVGVVAADLGLHFPDFRASERTFQLLTQVAGRAGRGEEPGRVIVQTFLPDHYAIALARTHDYPTFYREELARRKPHGYPPLRAMVQVALSGLDAEAVERAALAIAGMAKALPAVAEGVSGTGAKASESAVELLGPAPAPVARVRDRYRWQLLMLGPRDRVRETARQLRDQARGRFRGVALRVVVDPLQML